MLCGEVRRKKSTGMTSKSTSKDYLANEIRIVLVGKTGVGKSGTANTILGQNKFKSLPAGKSVTKYCEHASLKRFGRDLQVVDVQGFRDTSCNKAELHNQVMQCVALVSPGIHAILFIVRIGRYTDADVKTVEDFINIFGPNSKDFVIVVFTGEDDLSEDYDLQTFIRDSDVSLKTFLGEVNQRYISINNKACTEEKNRFVERLLDKIEQLLRYNKRSFYTCDMIDNVEEKIQQLDDMRVKGIEEKNRERDQQKIKEAIEEYKAQLAKERISLEESMRRIDDKKGDLNIQIATENHLEARFGTRVFLSDTIKKIEPAALTNAHEKNQAGLYAAMGVGATAGAAVGAMAGPLGAAIGGLAGATYGAVCNWFS